LHPAAGNVELEITRGGSIERRAVGFASDQAELANDRRGPTSCAEEILDAPEMV
jgi:hypothetical protein